MLVVHIYGASYIILILLLFCAHQDTEYGRRAIHTWLIMSVLFFFFTHLV